MKRLLFFFALMLGFVSVAFAQDRLTPETDYDAIIATFAGFAGGIVLLVEGIKKLFPKMSGIWTQLVSWLTGIVAVMLLWWLDAGFVADVEGISHFCTASGPPLWRTALPIRVSYSGLSACLPKRQEVNRHFFQGGFVHGLE